MTKFFASRYFDLDPEAQRVLCLLCVSLSQVTQSGGRKNRWECAPYSLLH